MGRPLNPDLTKYWKISLPATLAGIVEFYLFDRIHNKPQYGKRAELIKHLLEGWVEQQKTGAVRGDVLTILRECLNNDSGDVDVDSGLRQSIALLEKAAQAPQALNEEATHAAG